MSSGVAVQGCVPLGSLRRLRTRQILPPRLVKGPEVVGEIHRQSGFRFSLPMGFFTLRRSTFEAKVRRFRV